MATPHPVAALAVPSKAGSSRSSGKFAPDTLHRIPLELLDPNPWQPRTTMVERELLELMDTLRTGTLLQPICVQPKPDGRFLMVVGHRRKEAFARLLAEARTETERAKWATIPATIQPAQGDLRLAVDAYVENMVRATLTPLEEAAALEKMLAKGLAKTNEELAALVHQNVTRIQRLRKLYAAPRIVKDAVGAGLMVTLSTAPDGTERKELRKLELMAALAFIKLHERLRRVPPAPEADGKAAGAKRPTPGAATKRADERTETAVRRALAGNWSQRRCEDFVERLLSGKDDADAADGAKTGEVEVEAVFTRSTRRFAIDLEKLKQATAAQLDALRAALNALLAHRDPDAS